MLYFQLNWSNLKKKKKKNNSASFRWIKLSFERVLNIIQGNDRRQSINRSNPWQQAGRPWWKQQHRCERDTVDRDRHSCPIRNKTLKCNDPSCGVWRRRAVVNSSWEQQPTARSSVWRPPIHCGRRNPTWWSILRLWAWETWERRHCF